MTLRKALLLLWVASRLDAIVFDEVRNHEVISKVYEIREQQNFKGNGRHEKNDRFY